MFMFPKMFDPELESVQFISRGEGGHDLTGQNPADALMLLTAVLPVK